MLLGIVRNRDIEGMRQGIGWMMGVSIIRQWNDMTLLDLLCFSL